MPTFGAIVLPPLFLEHDYLRAARLLEDLCLHGCARDNRGPDLGRFAANRQNLVERYRRANLADQPLDRNLVADANAVLFSACPNDCKHECVRTNLIIGPIGPSQRTTPSRTWVSLLSFS